MLSRLSSRHTDSGTKLGRPTPRITLSPDSEHMVVEEEVRRLHVGLTLSITVPSSSAAQKQGAAYSAPGITLSFRLNDKTVPVPFSRSRQSRQRPGQAVIQ